MKVLIVVCAYNEEKRLLDCLKSIECSMELYNKTDVVYDVVCIDNSSSDDTRLIAKGFTKDKNNFHVITIKHCSLSVSRNSYKLFEGYDYIAYLDGDGGVDGNWCSELASVILVHKPDVISGPVLEHEVSSPNLIWEFYFDSKLISSQTYLIGANMVFHRALLDRSGGFPSIFYSRGDETGLLLRLKMLGVKYKHFYCAELVAYNCFDEKISTFFKTQYFDGKRSNQLYRLSNVSRYKCFVNFLYKFNSIAALLLAIPVSLIDVKVGVLLFMGSYIPHFLRTFKYHKNVFKKITQKKHTGSIRYAIGVLSSRYIFDFGYLVSFFSRKEKLSLEKIENPVVVDK